MKCRNHKQCSRNRPAKSHERISQLLSWTSTQNTSYLSNTMAKWLPQSKECCVSICIWTIRWRRNGKKTHMDLVPVTAACLESLVAPWQSDKISKLKVGYHLWEAHIAQPHTSAPTGHCWGQKFKLVPKVKGTDLRKKSTQHYSTQKTEASQWKTACCWKLTVLWKRPAIACSVFIFFLSIPSIRHQWPRHTFGLTLCCHLH